MSLAISRRKLKPGDGGDSSNGSVEIRATRQHDDEDDRRDSDFEKERGCCCCDCNWECECELSKSEGLGRKGKRNRWVGGRREVE